MMRQQRATFRAPLEGDISRLRSLLESIEPGGRLHAIAEAMCDLNSDGIEYHSCGCGEWDISIDYRDAQERHK